MKRCLHIIAALAMVWATPYASAKEPQNIAVIKKQLIQYHDSGEYQKDIKSVIRQAAEYLKKRVTHNRGNKKLAIILDIDETALSNYKSMRALNFGGTVKDFRVHEMEGNDPAIAPTLALFNYAKATDVAVFFVTGRNEEERAITTLNLHNAGFNDWNKLILRDSEYRHVPATKYKTAIRKALTEEGYDIVESIGDQKSDLTGGYADKTFKLPNPYYFIP